MLKTWQYLWWAGSLRPFPRTCTPDFSSMALLHRPLIPWRCTVSSLVWVLYLKVVIPTCDYLPWSVGSISHCFWLLCLKICLGGRGQLERVLLIWDQFSVGPVEGRSTWVEWASDFHHNYFQSITLLKKLERVYPFVVEVCFPSCDSPVLCTRSPFHSNTISLLCCVSNKSPIGYVSEHPSLCRHVPIPEAHWCPYAFLRVGEIQMNPTAAGLFQFCNLSGIHLLVMVSFSLSWEEIPYRVSILWKLGSILSELLRTVYFSLECGQLMVFHEGSTSLLRCLSFYLWWSMLMKLCLVFWNARTESEAKVGWIWNICRAAFTVGSNLQVSAV